MKNKIRFLYLTFEHKRFPNQVTTPVNILPRREKNVLQGIDHG